MFPFSFEWIWDMGHMVFHGGLWYAVTILSVGIAYCIVKTIIDIAQDGGSESHH